MKSKGVYTGHGICKTVSQISRDKIITEYGIGYSMDQ